MRQAAEAAGLLAYVGAGTGAHCSGPSGVIRERGDEQLCFFESWTPKFARVCTTTSKSSGGLRGSDMRSWDKGTKYLACENVRSKPRNTLKAYLCRVRAFIHLLDSKNNIS